MKKVKNNVNLISITFKFLPFKVVLKLQVEVGEFYWSWAYLEKD